MTEIPDIRGEGWPEDAPPVAVVLGLKAFGMKDYYRVAPLELWQQEPGCLGCSQCKWRKEGTLK